jgi:hypothetical protein
MINFLCVRSTAKALLLGNNSNAHGEQQEASNMEKNTNAHGEQHKSSN